MKKRENGACLVYSTEHGRMCPECGKPSGSCVCRREKPAGKTDGVVRLSLETKGRKGKGVTVITGLPLAAAELSRLAKQLKQRCGSGGTVKEGVVEIQGDHRPIVEQELIALGYRVKRVGS